MSPQGTKPNIALPGLLAGKFLKDYQNCAIGFCNNLKLELLEHLLGCLDLIQAYLSTENEENLKLYYDMEREFLKKHGKSLKSYMEKKFYLYYDDAYVLVEKGIYTPDEWNILTPEQQILSNSEFKACICLIRKLVNVEWDFLLLEQAEDQKQKLAENTENQPLILRRNKIKREAKDKMTSLSQEQTVLLFYYLQREKVFLKDEYLSDKEAATAFEILTGYSQNALRQSISRFNLWITPTNIEELERVLNRVKIAMGT